MDVLERRGVVSEGQRGEVGGGTRSKAPASDSRPRTWDGLSVTARKMSASVMPAASSLDIVPGRSCCGVLLTWRSYWSVEIVSGAKPSASAASNSPKSSDVMPWPTSNSTPFSRAASPRAAHDLRQRSRAVRVGNVGDHSPGRSNSSCSANAPSSSSLRPKSRGRRWNGGFEGQVQRHAWVAGTRRGAAAVDGDSPDQGAAVGDRLHTRVDVEPVEVIQAGTIGALAVTRDADRPADSSS
ncbi:MAG: hypothetical protein Ct9H300mP1_09930 [Planctomycetaceae bacterium]|nr:MAG: hypothetical protein Ct9H300mP1_09930 [Planctomycetaceae bacterium]